MICFAAIAVDPRKTIEWVRTIKKTLNHALHDTARESASDSITRVVVGESGPKGQRPDT